LRDSSNSTPRVVHGRHAEARAVGQIGFEYTAPTVPRSVPGTVAAAVCRDSASPLLGGIDRCILVGCGGLSPATASLIECSGQTA
jgi:hypothetical protein